MAYACYQRFVSSKRAECLVPFIEVVRRRMQAGGKIRWQRWVDQCASWNKHLVSLEQL